MSPPPVFLCGEPGRGRACYPASSAFDTHASVKALTGAGGSEEIAVAVVNVAQGGRCGARPRAGHSRRPSHSRRPEAEIAAPGSPAWRLLPGRPLVGCQGQDNRRARAATSGNLGSCGTVDVHGRELKKFLSRTGALASADSGKTSVGWSRLRSRCWCWGGSMARRSCGPAACGSSTRNSSSRHQVCTGSWGFGCRTSTDLRHTGCGITTASRGRLEPRRWEPPRTGPAGRGP